MTYPFPKTWWITPGRVLGGCFPGAPDPADVDGRLRGLLDVGVTSVIYLQEAAELGGGGKPFTPYDARLVALGADRGVAVTWARLPTRDLTPPSVTAVRQALDILHANDAVTYVHCWGGHGRTGVVAGCWLREQGMTAEEAFEAITEARAHDKHLSTQPSPQTDAQRARVVGWVKGHGA